MNLEISADIKSPDTGEYSKVKVVFSANEEVTAKLTYKGLKDLLHDTFNKSIEAFRVAVAEKVSADKKGHL